MTIQISIRRNPPGGDGWKQSLEFSRIIRVCFNAQDFMASDELYIFTDERPESYVIPMEASGGQELFSELIDRRLFSAELAIKAATGEGLYCWPSD